MLDTLLTAILIPPLVWKFGPIIVQPYNLIKHPLLVLFTRGTLPYWVIGSLLAILYFLYSIRKNKLDVFRVLDYLTFGALVFLIINNLFQWKYGIRTHLPWGISIHSSEYTYHPINVYNLILVGLIIVWLIIKRYPLGSGNHFSSFLLTYGIGSMAITFFNYEHPIFMELSIYQWINLVIIVIGWLLASFHSKIIFNKK